ncbi:MAG: phosphoribosylpyrophosphate synthetase [Pseudobdellovibrionaceae bacterium]
MFESQSKDVMKAGTGFMMQLSDALHSLEKAGYVENLIPRYDHFEARSGEFRIDPQDVVIDDILRFENASDPDDNSIAYAIRSRKSGMKGIYVESYGLYHDDLSNELMAKLQDHKHSTLNADQGAFQDHSKT